MYKYQNIYPSDVNLSDFVIDMSEHGITDMFMDSEAASYLLN